MNEIESEVNRAKHFFLFIKRSFVDGGENFYRAFEVNPTTWNNISINVNDVITDVITDISTNFRNDRFNLESYLLFTMFKYLCIYFHDKRLDGLNQFKSK